MPFQSQSRSVIDYLNGCRRHDRVQFFVMSTYFHVVCVCVCCVCVCVLCVCVVWCVCGQGEDGPARIANNVKYGDVFFCSGQSNMVFPLKLAFNASAEIKTLADFPDFRFFMTARANSTQPLEDFSPTPAACDASAGFRDCNRWLTAKEAALEDSSKDPTSSFVASFSAVCYMAARDLARLHTGNRPVGLIQSAWGGTRVEAWTSAAALASTPFASDVPAGKGPNAASVLYNAMVSPWNSFAVRAALWYQGEANADQKIQGVDQTQYYSAILQVGAFLRESFFFVCHSMLLLLCFLLLLLRVFIV